MRYFVIFLAVVSFAWASAVHAEEIAKPDPNGDLAPSIGEKSKKPPAKKPFKLAKDLDGLFDQLRRTRRTRQAELISERIWKIWQTSDSDSIDLLTNWARAAMQRKQFNAALDLLDQVVVIAPNYAEGWNQRATLHYMMENYGKSVADIEKTLALEPRHYGALAGLASIQQSIGNDRAALKTWYRALEIYPAMKSGQDAVIQLEEKLAGNEL